MINKIKAYLGNKDNKNIVYNVGSAFLIKGIAMIISFVSLPIYIRFFNNDSVLGIWYTILSILTWMLTFDFGVGNGLRNKLVGSLVKKDNSESREYISSSYVSITIIMSIFIVIGIPLILILNWNQILNIESTHLSSDALKTSVMIIFGTISVQFVLRIISSILYAYQKSSINNLITLITTVLQVGLVFVIPSGTNDQNLINLAIINSISVIIPLIIATIGTFIYYKSTVIPSIKYFRKNRAKEVLSIGMKIFYNQIAYLLLTGFNTYLITSLISPDNVVEYQTYYKIYLLFSTIFTLALTPFWSATTKAMEEKKYQWIHKNFMILSMLSLVTILFQIIILALNQFVFDVWLQEDTIRVNYLYGSMFAMFGTVFIIHNTLSTFAMGLNKTKLQAISYTVMVVVKFSLLFIVIDKYKDWVMIVMIDNFIFLIYSVLEFFSVKKTINKLITGYSSENRIFYLAHYDDIGNITRNVSIAAVNKMNYVIDSINGLGKDVYVISAAAQLRRGRYAKKVVDNENKIIEYLGNRRFKSKIFRGLYNKYFKFKFICTCLLRIKDNDTVIVYHSLYFINILRFINKIRKIKIIYEVEEIYGDVLKKEKVSNREIKHFRLADSYILATKSLETKIPKDAERTVLNGIYKTEDNSKKISNGDKGIIHCVYSGTLDPRKGGALAAAAAVYLDENYHIHILGFGSNAEVEGIERYISSIKSKAKVTYDGVKTGKDYSDFLSTCLIGLAPQDPSQVFNETSFPSKILSYMAHGLNVVSSDVRVVRESELASNIYFYEENSAESLAQTIKIASIVKQNHVLLLEKLDRKFKNELSEILK